MSAASGRHRYSYYRYYYHYYYRYDLLLSLLLSLLLTVRGGRGGVGSERVAHQRPERAAAHAQVLPSASSMAVTFQLHCDSALGRIIDTLPERIYSAGRNNDSLPVHTQWDGTIILFRNNDSLPVQTQ